MANSNQTHLLGSCMVPGGDKVQYRALTLDETNTAPYRLTEAPVTYYDHQFIWLRALLDIVENKQKRKLTLWSTPGAALPPGMKYKVPEWIDSPADYAKGIEIQTKSGLLTATELSSAQINFLLPFVMANAPVFHLIDSETVQHGFIEIKNHLISALR